MPQTETFRVKLAGDYACFSRPEFKVERVSYPVMTPSAARGALEAIFWKPEIRWEIRRIEILHPIATQSILRNEIDEQQSPQQDSFIVDRRRQQRASLILRDPAYVVEAEMIRQPHAEARSPSGRTSSSADWSGANATIGPIWVTGSSRPRFDRRTATRNRSRTTGRSARCFSTSLGSRTQVEPRWTSIGMTRTGPIG